MSLYEYLALVREHRGDEGDEADAALSRDLGSD